MPVTEVTGVQPAIVNVDATGVSITVDPKRSYSYWHTGVSNDAGTPTSSLLLIGWGTDNSQETVDYSEGNNRLIVPANGSGELQALVESPPGGTIGSIISLKSSSGNIRVVLAPGEKVVL